MIFLCEIIGVYYENQTTKQKWMTVLFVWMLCAMNMLHTQSVNMFFTQTVWKNGLI